MREKIVGRSKGRGPAFIGQRGIKRARSEYKDLGER